MSKHTTQQTIQYMVGCCMHLVQLTVATITLYMPTYTAACHIHTLCTLYAGHIYSTKVCVIERLGGTINSKFFTQYIGSTPTQTRVSWCAYPLRLMG